MNILTGYIAALEIKREAQRHYQWQHLAQQEDKRYLPVSSQPQKKIFWSQIFKLILKPRSSF